MKLDIPKSFFIDDAKEEREDRGGELAGFSFMRHNFYKKQMKKTNHPYL